MEHFLEPVGGVGNQLPSVPLARVVDDVAVNAAKPEAVSHALDAALTRAMTLPGQGHLVVDTRDQLTNGVSGVVGEQKMDVLFDRSAPGSETDMSPEDQLDQIAEHVRSLYAEMTQWQVAWSIAQRSQQDISHLLKGA